MRRLSLLLRLAATGHESRAGAAGPAHSPAGDAEQLPGYDRMRAKPVAGLADIAQVVERLRRAASKARYRPEKHYMRGRVEPGVAAPR